MSVSIITKAYNDRPNISNSVYRQTSEDLDAMTEMNIQIAEALPHPSLLQRTSSPGATTGAVRLLLRLEGATMLAAALVAYRQFGGEWGMFFLLLLVPDLSMAGYLFGPSTGARAYNAIHSYLGPALLAGLAWWLQHASSIPYLVSAVWIAHIGLDRLLGFGLKYPAGFKFTHLSSPGGRS